MLQRALGRAFLSVGQFCQLREPQAKQWARTRDPLPRPWTPSKFCSWLPPDTETVIVARDFTLPDPAMLEKTADPAMPEKPEMPHAELAFQGSPLEHGREHLSPWQVTSRTRRSRWRWKVRESSIAPRFRLDTF